MFRTASKIAFIALLVIAPRTFAQNAAKILSSEIGISRERAEIKLELEDGRHITLASIAGASVGKLPLASRFQRETYDSGDELMTVAVSRGDAVDRSWRDLLNRAMESETADLSGLLLSWKAPEGGREFQSAVDAVLQGIPLAPASPVAPGMNDSVVRLQDKIEQLQDQLQDARSDAISNARRHRGPDWLAPLRNVGRGISDIFATVVTYAVLFFLGFAVVMFGGRKYIEGVADTARHSTGRSFLVGLAGSFLLLPVFVLGIIALAISIVGIPALLAWIPLFPIAAVCACVLGFLGVAHAAGESWAERRYYGSEWFTRANSYYFMATGLALLASLFVAAGVVQMAGPWLRAINGLLNFFGIVATWAAVTIGFGAVLITRGGSRVEGRAPTEPATYDSANV